MWYQPYDDATGERFGAPSPSQGVLPAGYAYYAQEDKPVDELHEWIAADRRYVLRFPVPRIIDKERVLDAIGDTALEELESISIDRTGDSNAQTRRRACARTWFRRFDALKALDLNLARHRDLIEMLERLTVITVEQRDALLALQS